MELTVDYTIDLDHRVWIPVPLAFPWNGYADEQSWAAGLAEGLLDGIAAPDEVRARLQESALAMATMDPPLPGPLERFWHLPEGGGDERLVHLYATATEATTAEELAHLARAGVGGVVQTVTVLEDTAFDVALRAVVITEIPDRQIAVLRCLGLAGGGVFVIELIEEDPLVLELLEPHVEALFRSIRLRVDGIERASLPGKD